MNIPAHEPRGEKPDEVEVKARRGVIKQFFGVVLLSLGLLNTMFTLKGGLEPDPFNYALMIGGAVFLSVGVWQGRND